MIAANIGSGDVLLWLVEFFLFLIYFWLLTGVFPGAEISPPPGMNSAERDAGFVGCTDRRFRT